MFMAGPRQHAFHYLTGFNIRETCLVVKIMPSWTAKSAGATTRRLCLAAQQIQDFLLARPQLA